MREKFLQVALSQVGYKEKKSNKDLDSKTKNAGSGNYTKYGAWYGLNPAPWCCMFVSWCANEVGILGTLIPKYKGAGVGYRWFRDKNQLTMKPNPGDIGFLKPTKKGATSSHTFIVYEVLGDKITTIEGNLGNGVVKNTRRLTDKNILGFGRVKYPEDKYVDNVDYDGLNVRRVKDGSKTGELLQQATKVKVLKYEGKKALITKDTYVDKNYLVSKEPPFKTVFGADKDGLAVRKITLNIVGKKILTTLKNGHRVKVYKTKKIKKDTWYKVSPDSNAWCYSKYLK